MKAPEAGDEPTESPTDQANSQATSEALRVALAPLLDEPIDRLYTPDPTSVSEDTPVGDVLRLMQDRRMGSVLVVRGRRLVGIFTERDVVTKVLGESVDSQAQVGSVLTRDPVYLLTTDDVSKAIELMAVHGIRHLPVCEDDMEVVGILSVRKIIDRLAETYPSEVFNQPPRADILPASPEGG